MQQQPFPSRRVVGQSPPLPRAASMPVRAPAVTPAAKPALVGGRPAPETVPLRPRGKGVREVYWGGSRWFFDDGSDVKQPVMPKIGAGVHPRVAAQLAREAAGKKPIDTTTQDIRVDLGVVAVPSNPTLEVGTTPPDLTPPPVDYVPSKAAQQIARAPFDFEAPGDIPGAGNTR